MNNPLNNSYGRVVLITGASSGIGRRTAEELAGCGFTVYGGSRRAVPIEGITMLKLDVCSDSSVAGAVSEVISREGRIDILINAAGNGICGAVEECSGDEALFQMNTNYLGVVRMLNAVLPHMRRQRNGLVINVGSVGGIFSIPFQTMYSSSKYALEALTEGLRIELKPWGVKAALVEPGDTKTGFTAARLYSEKAKSSEYGIEFKNSLAQMEKDEQNGMDASRVTKVIFSLIKSKNPPVRRTVGYYKLLVFLKKLLPARLMEFILTLMYPKSGAAERK